MSKFVPFEIDEKFYQDFMNHLGELPWKFANPIISEFVRKAQAAQAVPEDGVG